MILYLQLSTDPAQREVQLAYPVPAISLHIDLVCSPSLINYPYRLIQHHWPSLIIKTLKPYEKLLFGLILQEFIRQRLVVCIFVFAYTINPKFASQFRANPLFLLSYMVLSTSSRQDISEIHLQYYMYILQLLESRSPLTILFSQLVCSLFTDLALSMPSPFVDVLSDLFDPCRYTAPFFVQNVAKSQNLVLSASSVSREFDCRFSASASTRM